jgi:DNA modification methylase
MSDYQLFHGDCLDILPGLEPGSIDAIIGDLPYGTTQCKWDTIIPFPDLWRVVRHVLKAKGAFVTTASQPFTSLLICSNLEWFRHETIWEKDNGTNFLNLENMPFKVHENILVFSEGQTTYNPQKTPGKPYRVTAGKVFREYLGAQEKGTTTINSGDRYPRSVSFFSQERGDHATQKPVALYEYLIRTYTNPGETVLDLTMGSGTTGVAAIQTGRKFVGIEKEREYFEIAERRIQNAQPPLFV